MTYIITEYFANTNETVERNATKDQIAEFEIRQAKYAALELAKQERAAQRDELLARLGLSSDEAKLLIAQS